MNIAAGSISTGSPSNLRIVADCPNCGKGGTFDSFNDVLDIHISPVGYWLGQRKCPNRGCNNHIFFIRMADGKLLTYPTQRFSFDRADIPETILRAFDEAVISHSTECYTASAIMIRKTLEEICADRKAEGGDLQKRLESLKSFVVLPQELFDALQDLRLLGNDAAHIKSKTFNQVSREEVEAGLELTREILKAVYQLKGLVGKLKDLKIPATESSV